MRRFKRFLCLLGVLLLVAAVWAWRSGAHNQRIWAKTLDEAKLERAALFLERDKLPIDADRQARLLAWSKAYDPVVKDGSITVPSWYSFDDFAPQTLRWRPELKDSSAVALQANQKCAEALDVILREGPTFLGGWVTVPADATDEQISRHSRRTPDGSHVWAAALYWFVAALTQRDPEPALAAWDRIMAASFVPSGEVFPLITHNYSAQLRDKVYLNLIVRGRLSNVRLHAWLREPGRSRADLAAALRLRRAVFVSAELSVRLKRDRGHLDRIASSPRSALRRWWYARGDGPLDANWIIRNHTEWEQWLSGVRDVAPAVVDPESADVGRYIRRRWPYVRYAFAQMVRRETQHRNARLLGAALAARSTKDQSLWANDAAFREAVGDAVHAIDHGDATLPSRYVRLAEDRASLGPPDNVPLPSALEGLRDLYFRINPKQARMPATRCVSYQKAQVSIRLPSSR